MIRRLFFILAVLAVIVLGIIRWLTATVKEL